MQPSMSSGEGEVEGLSSVGGGSCEGVAIGGWRVVYSVGLDVTALSAGERRR